MGYHAINEGSNITVYRIAGCPSDEIVGTLYNGEVFTVVGEHQGYLGNYEIRYLNSNGSYSLGFIDDGQYGNLAYSGMKVTESALGNACYRFKLRKSLKVVNSNGGAHTTLNAGDYVYTRGATCGASTKENMYMIDIVQEYHMWAYAILFLIIFCETGLVVTAYLRYAPVCHLDYAGRYGVGRLPATL